jgi:site-specific recombinase XerC
MKEARYTDLINEFVKGGKLAKATLLNYKKQLEAQGKIKKRINTATNRPVYHVPKKWMRKVEELKARRGLNSFMDDMSLEELRMWFNRFKERGTRLRFTDNIVVKDKNGKVKGKGIGIGGEFPSNKKGRL